MAAWDAEPELDPGSGLPYAFSALPRATHVALWSGAARLVLAQSPYAALLVSLHGTGLYERFVAAEERRREPVRGYLEREHAFQRRLAAELGAGTEGLERNAALLRCWDWMSLLLCGGGEGRLEGVPAVAGSAALELRQAAAGAVAVSPWPFLEPRLELRVWGRLLEGRFADEEALREALAAAPWVELELELRPAG